MTKVIFDISMSLDGFMTAANMRPEEPMCGFASLSRTKEQWLWQITT